MTFRTCRRRFCFIKNRHVFFRERRKQGTIHGSTGGYPPPPRAPPPQGGGEPPPRGPPPPLQAGRGPVLRALLAGRRGAAGGRRRAGLLADGWAGLERKRRSCYCSVPTPRPMSCIVSCVVLSCIVYQLVLVYAACCIPVGSA